MSNRTHKEKFTILGFIAIIIWGTSAVFTRNLSTTLGPYTSAALVNIIGGLAVLIRQFVKDGGIKEWRRAPKQYWIVCGSLFIIYTATSYVSIQMVEKNEAVITMVLIRFMWPLFTLIFSINILKAKTSRWLPVGILLCMIGIVVAKLGTKIFDLPNFFHNLNESGEIVAYLLSFVVAIGWALYTNFMKKYIKDMDVDGSGVFMFASGIILGIIALNVDEPRDFSMNILYQMIYAAVVVSSIANVLWNLSIKKGNMLIVVLASNFLPIISTVMAALMLHVGITLPVIIGSILVVAGIFFSKWCFDRCNEKGIM